MKYSFLLCGLAIFSLSGMTDDIRRARDGYTVDGQKEIAIVVPTYNNSRGDVCIKNISSLLNQDYDNYSVYIINDCSTDDTSAKIKDYIKSHPYGARAVVIDNNKRLGAMANYYHVISSLDDHVIVLNVDGDDWLSGPHVLAYINEIYNSDNIWLTYGQYQEYPSGNIGFCAGYPKSVILNNSYRKHGLPVSHLRTYYAWLFKKIDPRDLMYKNRFVQVTCDKVLMTPMIEMSGGRFKCIQDVLYIYNANNPISDMRIAGPQQAMIRDRVFALSPYEPLAQPIFDFATDIAAG
jgi:glycosyltransferase involved in cell wall biosynthesis